MIQSVLCAFVCEAWIEYGKNGGENMHKIFSKEVKHLFYNFKMWMKRCGIYVRQMWHVAVEKAS